MLHELLLNKWIVTIGISNRSLDASKMINMNFLQIPEPNEQDLRESSKSIAEDII
jgi:hypothetical protein